MSQLWESVKNIKINCPTCVKRYIVESELLLKKRTKHLTNYIDQNDAKTALAKHTIENFID